MTAHSCPCATIRICWKNALVHLHRIFFRASVVPAPPVFRPSTVAFVISIRAESRLSDGSPLVLLPHDCRRVFASEHLNNNTPVHIIQAVLAHASPDRVMIYDKLYPGKLIEYRKTVRRLY